MLLAVNIGNTNTVIGIFEGGKLTVKRRPTKEIRNSPDCCRLIRETIICGGCALNEAEGSVLASVVPQLTDTFRDAVKQFTGRVPVIAGRDINTGLKLAAYEGPLLGSDRIAVCAYAWEVYKSPMVVIDMGTATTLNVIDENGAFLGGAILPGLSMGIEALSKGTAQLPEADFSQSFRLIGHNTGEAILSGALYGTAAMTDGMLQRIRNEIQKDMRVIITGGNSKYILKLCREKMIYEPELLLKGLELLFRLNCS